MTLTLPIRPRRIALILGVIAFYLAAQSIFGRYIEDLLGDDTSNLIANLVRVLNINRESSIPTWYSASLLLGCAGLLGLVAAAKRANGESYVRHWTGLAVIFLYLSIDEAAAIHESFTEPLQIGLDATNYLYFAWVIVAAPLVLLFGLVYLKFLFHLPPRFRNLFILAGGMYVGGALVIEVISANRWYLDSGSSLLYSAIGTLEELFEMWGVIVLIYALLAYAVDRGYVFTLHPQSSAEPFQTPRPIWAALARRRWIIPLVVVMIGMNAALLLYTAAQPPVTAPPAPTPNPAVTVEGIIEAVVTGDVVVTRLIGEFTGEGLPSPEVVAALLDIFDEVMILTAISLESSIAFAADELPFDREELAEVLRTYGETQYIIFDTPAVRALVGSS